MTLQITGLVAFLGIDLGSVIGQRLEYCMYSVGGPESIPPVGEWNDMDIKTTYFITL